jgi:hypothetical protein
MGVSIGEVDRALNEKNWRWAAVAFVAFMSATGLLAMEIDELDISAGDS